MGAGPFNNYHYAKRIQPGLGSVLGMLGNALGKRRPAGKDCFLHLHSLLGGGIL